jgi:hypothetical protein
MIRPIAVIVMVWASAGCGRTVSCDMDLGMCHEWIDASPGLRREVQAAVCHKSDEHFAEGPCRRQGVAGVCEDAGGRQRTLFYEPIRAGDPAAICRETGGTYTPGPAR